MEEAWEAWEERQLLFIYGSLLLPTGDPAVDGALSLARNLGPGFIQARLYDLGDYPGACISNPNPNPNPAPGDTGLPPKVLGRLLGVADPDPFFQILDRYEGFDPARPLAGEFVRSTTSVVVIESGRSVFSQVYFYNLDLSDKPAIPSGDYLAFLEERRRGNR